MNNYDILIYLFAYDSFLKYILRSLLIQVNTFGLVESFGFIDLGQ